MRKKEVMESIRIPEGNALDRIRSMMPYFSKGHKRVAEYILSDYEKAVFLTSFKMGQQCGVSESSIIRFATTLGYNGYTEMQRDLQDLLKQQLTMSKRLKGTSGEDEKDTMQNIMQHGIDGIQHIMDRLSMVSFNQAVELLAHADRVYLVGSRSSYGLVYFFSFVLNWIRDSVHALNGSIDCIDDLSTLTEKDVVLTISLPRYPRSTVKVMEAAKKRGARTIAITDTMTSPLIPYTDVPLLVYTELVSYSDNVAPIMCLITALVTAVGAVDQQRTVERLEQHEKYWEESDLYV